MTKFEFLEVPISKLLMLPEFKTHTYPHPQPFSRLREKGVNSSIEIELE
jgi:hypothetical protein